MVKKSSQRKNILILCTGNSCRSQMAEGYFRHFCEEKVNVYSAGGETHGLNPKAVQVMKEDGIDISHHTSTHLDDYAEINFDFVITVCDNAREQCPVYPKNTRKIHKSFRDPAKAEGSPVAVLRSFRAVRDQIKNFTVKFCSENL